MLQIHQLMRDGQLSSFLLNYYSYPNDDGNSNAHSVAVSLMGALASAGAASGWTWRMGLVRAADGGEHEDHSWLEADGWAIDASRGTFVIYPAWMYRGRRSPKDVTSRDAAATVRWLRESGSSPEMAQAIEDALNKVAMVQVLDPSTAVVAAMPIQELSPGMMLKRVQGRDDLVWSAPSAADGPLRQDPLPATMRTRVRHIAKTLRDVDPMSASEWEVMFRSAPDLEHVVSAFECIAETYRRITTRLLVSSVARAEYYQALCVAPVSTREAFCNVIEVKAISKQQALMAADLFYSIWEARRGAKQA